MRWSQPARHASAPARGSGSCRRLRAAGRRIRNLRPATDKFEARSEKARSQTLLTGRSNFWLLTSGFELRTSGLSALLDVMAFQAAVERRTAQSQRARGAADVAVVLLHRLAHEHAFDVEQTHLRQRPAARVERRAPAAQFADLGLELRDPPDRIPELDLRLDGADEV